MYKRTERHRLCRTHRSNGFSSACSSLPAPLVLSAGVLLGFLIAGLTTTKNANSQKLIRAFNVNDLLANMPGILIGFILAIGIKNLIRKLSH